MNMPLHRNGTKIALLGAALLPLAFLPAASCNRKPTGEAPPVGTTGDSTTVVMGCDGEPSTMKQPSTSQPATPETGKQVAADLLAQWQARNPEREWAMDPNPAHAIVPGADNRALVAGSGNADTQAAGHTYGSFTEHDIRLWQRELERAVAEGDRIFHDAAAMGGTIGVSCDMCHPNAANTHPETYPKYQTQMGRIALLRDMINWCLENPVRAPAMQPDDPRMRALEAYIYAQRRGVPLDYGKH